MGTSVQHVFLTKHRCRIVPKETRNLDIYMCLSNPKIYLKKIYVYPYIYERTFYNAKKSFENFGKLIRFLFIKLV